MSEPEYTMRISLNILDHLGVNLYSDVPPVLSEVVANSWDADASEVDIDIDIEHGKITITDNGHGMTLKDMNEKYLTVGYDRRYDDKKRNMVRTAEHNRHIMGRKGIGKLALFSIADTVEVQSATGEGEDGFVMSAQKIKEQSRKEQNNREEVTPYHPDPLPDDKITLDKNGTRITLTKLKTRVTKATSNALKKRLARRFSIIGSEHNFTVRIDGNPVKITDRDYFHKLQYLWHHGEGREKYLELCKPHKPEYMEKREEPVEAEDGINYPVTGWIGTTDLPSDLKDGDENLNKIIIMVRGKLAQEDILEDITEGGVYTKYIIGEIHADFLDLDGLEDIATSNRQEIIKDDPRYIALRSWVNKELRHIKSKWTDLRNKGGVKEATQIPAINEWMQRLDKDKQDQAKSLLGKIGELSLGKKDRIELYQYSVLAFESLMHKGRLSALEKLSPENLHELTRVFADQAEIESSRYYQIVNDRLSVINTLDKMVQDNALEKMIQNYLAENLWLLDPSWERAADPVYVEEPVAAAFKEIDDKLKLRKDELSKEERRGRIDIRYKKMSGQHVIIELKRPEVKINDYDLMRQVEKYGTALQKVIKQHGSEGDAIDIVCVVGEPLQQWETLGDRMSSNRSLSEKSIRVVLYRELIGDARLIYKEFLEQREDAGRVCELIKNIEIESP